MILSKNSLQKNTNSNTRNWFLPCLQYDSIESVDEPKENQAALILAVIPQRFIHQFCASLRHSRSGMHGQKDGPEEDQTPLTPGVARKYEESQRCHIECPLGLVSTLQPFIH